MKLRRLGRSNVKVSPMGMGCWAIGGPFWHSSGRIMGYGHVDDEESIRTVHRAIELGVNFFDTADVYGCGHSEKVLGKALADYRDDVIIATKFGSVFDPETKRTTGGDASPEYIKRACEASLKRLRTDHIDLYQFHMGGYDPEEAVQVRNTLDELVEEGKIRAYGWSTDLPDRARVFGEGEHCTSTQYRLNITDKNDAMLDLCQELDLASVIKGPLAGGILTGKYQKGSKRAEDHPFHSVDFGESRLAELVRAIDGLQELIADDGRTLAQLALSWLLAQGDMVIPIPGAKTVTQIEENAGTLEFGALKGDLLEQVDHLFRPLERDFPTVQAQRSVAAK